MPYRLHQAVGTPPLLIVVWAKLGRHPQGGVCPVGMGTARPRWRAVPVRPPRRGHAGPRHLLFPPYARASGSIFLHQDEGSVEQATTPRARVGPRGRGACGGAAAAVPGLIVATVRLRVEGTREGQQTAHHVPFHMPEGPVTH